MPKNKLTEKEMIGGCCVCSDDRGWPENPLVYCDGEGCDVAVHQACYGIVTIPATNWYCRKCETFFGRKSDLEQVKCELCPSKAGALKLTDEGNWAHVVCALYIPEVSFSNVTTMEPIIVNHIPPERFNKTCYICEENGKGAIARVGACMQCNRSGCKRSFHVTCAQMLDMLCEEAGNYQGNVKYCGYCHHHYNKLFAGQKKGGSVKSNQPHRPLSSGDEIHDDEPNKHASAKRKLSSSGGLNKASKTSGNTGSDTNNDESSQMTNGDSPELVKTASGSSVNNKKRKSNRSSTPSVHSDASSSALGGTAPPTSESPRPVTPSSNASLLRPISPGTQSFSATNGGGVSKVGSIVVQVPLEAAGVGNTGSNSPSHSHSSSSVVPSSSPTPLHESHHQPAPAKRSRSESSDKGEKRRSKRSGSGLPPRPHRKPSSPTRIKSSPEPSLSGSFPLSGGVPPKLITSSSTGSNVVTVSGVAKPASSVSPLIKEEKDVKLYENGVAAAHMLGNQLNPGSSMADTLSQEVAAHSIYTKSNPTSHVGPIFPKPTPYRGPGSSNSSTGASSGGGALGAWGSTGVNMPQTLEQLLERQWEQGSQFLMEQAHHFDIASLLSCLHQLKAENAQLEEHVNSLQARRDNLLAVNARLAIPLIPSQHSASGTNNINSGTGSSGRSSSNASAGVASGVGTGLANSVTNVTIASTVMTNSTGSTANSPAIAIVENGIPSVHEQYRASTLHSGRSSGGNDMHRESSSSHRSSGSSTINPTSSVTFSSTSSSQQSNSHHHGGGAGGIGSSASHSLLSPTNPQPVSHQTQSSVVVRANPTVSTMSQQGRSTSSSYSGASFTSSNTQVLVRRVDDQHKSNQGS